MAVFALTLIPPASAPESRSVQKAVQIHAIDPVTGVAICAVSPLLMTDREIDETVAALIAELDKLRPAAKSKLKERTA